MTSLRIWQVAAAVFVVACAIPGAYRVSAHYGAYELLWMIPLAPLYTSVFFGIVIAMVSLFIASDSYKDPRAISQAKRFLNFFNWLFIVVLILFMITDFFLYQFCAPSV